MAARKIKTARRVYVKALQLLDTAGFMKSVLINIGPDRS
jgi:hypothetical protein